MTFWSNVAPRRRVESLPQPWRCECRDDGHMVIRPGYLKRCPACKAERPK